MKHFIAFLLLTLTSCTPAMSEKPYDADARDGSVIFWQGGMLSKPILRRTDSDLTHAAIVLYQDGVPFVYEAVPPRVHKVPLSEYRQMMEEESHHRHPKLWFVMQPMDWFTPSQLTAMKNYAESQLGRPYMLRGWWKGYEVRGVFCSELIADIISQSGKIESAGVRESPGSLHDKLLPFYWELSTP